MKKFLIVPALLLAFNVTAKNVEVDDLNIAGMTPQEVEKLVKDTPADKVTEKFYQLVSIVKKNPTEESCYAFFVFRKKGLRSQKLNIYEPDIMTAGYNAAKACINTEAHKKRNSYN
ncbi:hypothetical protein [Photobacterium damselae]|uniref:hypothetical protein n=1 Tax=Photobacterium damselae TaxID=38293 RepID=UPI00165D71F5|nr:hypothetical protein [Photobacterium damselae]